VNTQATTDISTMGTSIQGWGKGSPAPPNVYEAMAWNGTAWPQERKQHSHKGDEWAVVLSVVRPAPHDNSAVAR
jgi:hypothetical protein